MYTPMSIREIITSAPTALIYDQAEWYSDREGDNKYQPYFGA